MSSIKEIEKANWDEFWSAHCRFAKSKGFYFSAVGPSHRKVYGRSWRVASRLNRIQRHFEYFK